MKRGFSYAVDFNQYQYKNRVTSISDYCKVQVNAIETAFPGKYKQNVIAHLLATHLMKQNLKKKEINTST